MPERFRGELLTMGRYTNPAFFFLPFTTLQIKFDMHRLQIMFEKFLIVNSDQWIYYTFVQFGPAGLRGFRAYLGQTQTYVADTQTNHQICLRYSRV